MADSWLRLETKMAFVGWTAELSPVEYAAWVKFLQTVKLHGQRGGRIRRSYFDDRFLGLINTSRNAFDTMLVKAKVGDDGDAAVEENGSELIVKGWHRYQLDPTASERMARHRGQEPKDVTHVTDVTVCNGCHDDGTGRDGTGHIYDAVTDVTVTPETPVNEHNDHIGGAGPPPRETKDLPGVAHVGALIDQFNAGKENPKGQYLRRPSPDKIRAKLLDEGFRDSDLEALTIADLKKSLATAEHLRRSWGPGFLVSVLDAKSKTARAQSRSPIMPQMKAMVDPREKVLPAKTAERQRIVDEVRKRPGCDKLTYTQALNKWADEQLEKERDE